MPWKETDVAGERIEFVVRALSESSKFSALCREFGICRKTGYKWLHRFEEVGSVSRLGERSRRPHHSPSKTPEAVELRVEALRQRYGWGSKKLQCLLAEEGLQLPRITIDRILKRRGLVCRARAAKPAQQRFERRRPNELWQMDFKGEYRRQGRPWVYPLSLLDDHSRYCLGLYALRHPDHDSVQSQLVRTFEHYGLPEAMLMDHGTPWWSPANGHGLTRLSVFLVQQDIRLIYSGIGHPQTQGKVERFHRTLGESVGREGVLTSRAAYQRAFDSFRREYNEIRPHEALEMKCPAMRYSPSRRQYRPKPPEWEYPPSGEVRRLNAAGLLSYASRQYFVCEALAKQRVWCQRFQNRLLVTYRSLQIREIDLETGLTTAVVRPVGD
ncbi:MAG: IS481 family transposase [Thermoanaerobaculia bacterium]|jgi:transposase InsO family protein